LLALRRNRERGAVSALACHSGSKIIFTKGEAMGIGEFVDIDKKTRE